MTCTHSYTEVPGSLISKKSCHHTVFKAFCWTDQEQGGQACSQVVVREGGPCTLTLTGTLALATPKKKDQEVGHRAPISLRAHLVRIIRAGTRELGAARRRGAAGLTRPQLHAGLGIPPSLLLRAQTRNNSKSVISDHVSLTTRLHHSCLS